MKRSEGMSRIALAATMALCLAITPLRAKAGEADADPDPGMDGVGNLISYGMCAGGIVAGALSGNFNTLLGAMVFCRALYRDAV